MSPSATLKRLSAWPELWRHPKLFARVHGSGGVGSEDVLAALLAQEVDSPGEAWRSVLEENDLAAIEAAYQQIGPAIGIDAARRDLERARGAFLRRLEALGDRARVLTAGRAATENALGEARRMYLAQPRAAERLVAAARVIAEGAEHEQLEHLRRVHLAGGADSASHQDLADAIDAGDLRRALIFAGHFEQAMKPAQPLPHELRLERQPTGRLIRWRLDPDLAPAWVPRVNLNDHDLALLMLVDALQSATSLDFNAAADFTRIAFSFLLGRTWTGEMIRGRSRSADTWSISVRGEGVADLFPFAVDEKGEAELVFPGTPAAHWPIGEDGSRFVGFDLFETWRLVSRSDAVIATPRIFLDLVGTEASRPSAFVRLQSQGIAVRQLILNVLGRDLGRALRLARLEGGAESSATDVIVPLLEALDLYVDQGDVLAIADACGDRLFWLLPVLHVAARALDTAPPSHRRFDALNLLRQPVVERELEAMFKTELEALLPDTVLACLVLDTAEDLFELRTDSEPVGVDLSELAGAIVRRGYLPSETEAEVEISRYLQVGLLRNVPALNRSPGARQILASLPLPARCLLGASS